MKYSLIDIWNQAEDDINSAPTQMPKGESILGAGVKIQKFGNHIEILNTAKGGDYFKELDKDEYEFFKDGWKMGAINLALSNYSFKLDLIEQKLKQRLTQERMTSTSKTLKVKERLS